MDLIDATLAPLSILRNPRWLPRWPPSHKTCYNSASRSPRDSNLVSITRFLGSRNPFFTFAKTYRHCFLELITDIDEEAILSRCCAIKIK